MKVKAGQALIDIAKVAYEANQPILLIGKHGVGKSELVAQAAANMGVCHIVRDLSLMEPPDLAGLPIVEDGKMNYAIPAFLPTDGRGLLVFEELNRAPRYLQSPCLQLLTARRLNDYILPKGWLPVACVNPVANGYHTDELDAALASRFLKVEVVPDVSLWLAWARANRIDQRVCDFVAATPKVFDPDDSNPRAWTYVSNTLKAWARITATKDTLLACLEGFVGPEMALAFFQFSLGDEKPLDAGDVLQRYTDTRKAVLRWKGSGKLDLLQSSLHKMQTFIQSETNWTKVQSDSDQVKRLGRFIKDLPGDLRSQARRFMRDRGYALTGGKP